MMPRQNGQDAVNAEAYLDKMIRLLRNDGVRFSDKQTLKFATLDPLEGDILHADGSWEDDDTERLVAVVFGPQHGPVTAMQVEECLPIASRRGYDELVFAGFSFDGAAQAIIQEDPNPRVRIHIAHINPDVAMGDLLKETPSTQLFTVFGMPRTTLQETTNGEYIIKMEGVDIYNPVDNTVSSAGARTKSRRGSLIPTTTDEPSASPKPSFPTRAHGTKSPAPSKVSSTKIALSSSAVQNLFPSLLASMPVSLSKSSIPVGMRSCACIIYGGSIKSSRHAPCAVH